MRYPRSLVVIAGTAIVGACATDQPTAPTVRSGALDASAEVIANGVPTAVRLVKYASGAEAAARTSIAARGGTVARHLPELGLLYVRGLDEAKAAALAGSSGVAVVASDVQAPLRHLPSRLVSGGKIVPGPKVQGTDQSAAQFFAFQWNMRSTSANKAWTPSGGGLGETVCVLDTGVDPGHVDLNGRVLANRFITGILTPRFQSDLVPHDFDFHGTFVSSLITSNGLGMASTAPNASLCSIKVLSQDGNGTYGDIIYGIVQAGAWNAHVINLSLGGVLDIREPSHLNVYNLLQQAVNYALSRGSLVVAASGNIGVNFDEVPKQFVNVPSMLAGVVSVGATAPVNQQNFDLIATYSNVGGVRTLDLVAPGGDLVAGGVTADLVLAACSQYAQSLPFTCSPTSFLFASGTSFASPMVAGAAAVVESTKGPMTTSALEACLLSTTDKVGSKWVFGAGRLNVLKAISCT